VKDVLERGYTGRKPEEAREHDLCASVSGAHKNFWHVNTGEMFGAPRQFEDARLCLEGPGITGA